MFVIYFQSKVEETNTGYFYRNRKEGFTSVFKPERAKKFQTMDKAEERLAMLTDKEGEYYYFEVQEV